MNNNGLRVENKTQVVLCGDRVCCPILERLSSGKYKLTDDDGNSVIITAEQARLIDKGIAKCDEINNQQISEQQLLCE